MNEKVWKTNEIELNKEQIQTFANSIIADIRPYIEAHKEEYEEFLKEWSEKGGVGN